MPRSRPLGPTALRAVQEAAAKYDLAWEDLLVPLKRRELVLARRAAMVALREQGWTQPRIARVFGVDHTTVLYHLRQAQKETDNG